MRKKQFGNNSRSIIFINMLFSETQSWKYYLLHNTFSSSTIHKITVIPLEDWVPFCQHVEVQSQRTKIKPCSLVKQKSCISQNFLLCEK